MPKVEVNGVQLYYETNGQGYPVVFLHGFAGTVSSWNQQVPMISSKYRFIRYDARGHGRSESPLSPDEYSADMAAEDLVQLLKVLRIRRAVIGGLSMGGYIALRFYLRYPTQVAALILISTGPGYRNTEHRESWNHYCEKRVDILENQGIKAFADAAPQSVNYTPRDIMITHNPIGLAHVLRKVMRQFDTFVIDNLDKISVPTLIVAGENDKDYLPAAQYLAKVVLGSRYKVIPKAHHAVNVENAPAFNSAILDFLGRLNLRNHIGV